MLSKEEQCYQVVAEILISFNYKNPSSSHILIGWYAQPLMLLVLIGALSHDKLSPHALSPNGLRNARKNEALQVDFFLESS